MKKIKIGIVGAAGYTGGELCRLLLNHIHANLVWIYSRSQANKNIYEVHDDLFYSSLKFSDDLSYMSTLDLIFLCLNHQESKIFLRDNYIPDTIKIIDLSQDFRLQPTHTIANRTFVYGLPEFNFDQIKSSNSIANPGCFATAIQIAIAPLATFEHKSDIYITGITGATGAGKTLSESSHFSWRLNNIQPYKTLTHQHLNEINQQLNLLAKPQIFPNLHFVPWRGNFARGIFISASTTSPSELPLIQNHYQKFYSSSYFIRLSAKQIHLKQVINTNFGLIFIEKINHTLVIHCCIDNLLKGACGQAIQNMNICFGFSEKEGLGLKSNYF